MNSDFRDLLSLFAKHEVRCLVAGGYAVMHYSQPRFTKDLDLWLKPSMENAASVMRAFAEFGMPLIDVTKEGFASEGLQCMVGRAPVLFDFLTTLPGLDFETCWTARRTDESEGFPILLDCGGPPPLSCGSPGCGTYLPTPPSSKAPEGWSTPGRCRARFHLFAHEGQPFPA